ncbi:Heterokaryon incompatibility protein 6, OR allele [Madurella mycetomatis]|uniref:Heterokaryon incompatibility protein 6, OR allele n=1 Tax=Madurella mycetomatis TaxID=100816 RepID=A0A175W4U6_9PEZI|nr:Heterokaryon incompatibility protein 6, OR allele [Madurella mycetomatis]
MAAVRMYSLNRHAFLTRNGRIGIGPKVMQPGDEVALLLGGKLPFVLRPRSDHHVFVSACYVRDDDVMWGVETEKVRFNKPGARPRSR